MRFFSLAMLGIATLLASCATQYGKSGFTGGYSDEKIDETHYRVKFNGNGYAKSDRVWSFWMYRCAELAKEKGYTHFSLHKPGAVLVLSPGTSAQPALHTADYKPQGDAPFAMRKTAGAAPIFIYIPGQTITTYSSEAVVGLHRTPLPEGIAVLNAQTVLDLLDLYVKSNGEKGQVSSTEVFEKASSVLRARMGYTFGGEL